MLKKIKIEEVRLGMFLYALEGSWIDHPFWKTRFVIDEPEVLHKLRHSAIKEVWIDIGKGLDVAVSTERGVTPRSAGPGFAPASAFPSASPAALSPAAPTPTAPGPSPVSATRVAPVPMSKELRQAAAICNRGKEEVRSMFQQARLGKLVSEESAMPLVEDISNSVLRNPGALVSLARLKTQDQYTYLHSVAVCALMVALGREIGLDKAECRSVGLAGLMHDLGKALMPLEILNKPDKLTDGEFSVMRAHPERGHAMLLEGGSTHADVLDVCLHHHERVDGTGYPHRLHGEAIGRAARMGAICDVYDAITSDRPYKKGWDPAEAIARMASWKGHFDPVLFGAFVKSVGIYPVGSLVRLASNRLAVVVELSSVSLTAPVVKVFFSVRSNMPIPAQRLDLAEGKDRIVSRESAEQWGFTHLDELWLEGVPRPGA